MFALKMEQHLDSSMQSMSSLKNMTDTLYSNSKNKVKIFMGAEVFNNFAT